MARLLGPDQSSRLITQVLSYGTAEFSGRLTTVYSDAAGTVPADIATHDGTTTVGAVISGSQVRMDSTSRLPQFWFPADGTDVLYAQPVGGPLVQIRADTDSRLDVAESAGGLSARLPTPRPKVLQHITSMQTGHGWTVSNVLSSNLNDTTVFAMGSQSATFTAKTDTTAATLTTAALSPALDITASKQLRLLIRVEGLANVTGLSLYATSDNFATAFGQIKIQNQTPDLSVMWLKEGEWKWVTLNWADAAITGSPNLAAIDHLRIRLTCFTATSATVHLQAVQVIERKAYASGGVVCFTYDDSYSSQYTIAAKRLDLYGFQGTAYTIVSNIAAGDAANSLYMTTAQLKSLHDNAGWEVCPHAYTISNHSRAAAGAGNPMSAAELDLDLRQTRQWLVDNNLDNGYNGYCYPQGKFTTAVRQQLAAGRSAYARAMTSTANAAETIPPADPYALRCYTLDNATVLATFQGYVDACAANGGLLILCAHEIVTPATTSTQVTQANHDGIVDYVAGKAGIRVMTLGDVMRSLTAQG